MDSTQTALETLIDTVYDSVEGYQKAADLAKTPALKQALAGQSAKRQETLDMLNAELVRLGGDLVTKGTMTGGLHRLWLDLTALFESGDEAAVERVEEGEEYLAKKFEEVLEHTDLDRTTRAVIEAAHAEVRDGARFTAQLDQQYD